jgi:outer membrane biosynthesis protein TonB
VPHAVASPLALALVAAAAILLGACGEEDAQLLPGGTAREITANLDTVQLLADEGDCVGAESAALQVSEQVEALGEVDPELKQALREGAARLNEVVAGCEEEVAVLPDETTTESEPGDDEEAEREEKEQEKEEEKEEKEREKEERESEKEAERDEETPLPPQAEGEGKGLDDGDDSGPGNSGEGGAPSGGVSPSSPVEGDD